MRRILVLVTGAVLAAVSTAVYFLVVGVDARSEPRALEERVAHAVRRAAISMRTRGVTNPVASTDEVVAEGRDHYADHCAVCHANDGSGNTEMGRNLYPRVPDMRLAATQNLTDAELFYIIENGVRLTGMPGWSTGTKQGEIS